MKLLPLLRSLPPRTVLMVVGTHLLLLAGILWGGLPYLALQVLLAAELVVINLASVALYRERGLRKHVGDLLKTIAGMVFILFFVLVTYGVARVEGGGSEDYPLPVALASLAAIDTGALAWAFGYMVLHLSASLWLAFSSPDPRLAWAKSTLSEGGTTFVGMFLMIFVAIFVATPFAAALVRLGFAVDIDILLACLMVALRTVLALVMATVSERETAAMAANPFLS